MIVQLENIGKRYQREWIFRRVDTVFHSGESVAILGGNGSGKSTLLQMISGYLSPSEGRIVWEKKGAKVSGETVFREMTWCTPALQLFEDLTLEENIAFFLQFKSLRHSMSTSDFAERIGLKAHQHKVLHQYSSGMKQRVKLGLAILGKSELLLLDEPTSHLDAEAISWYQQLLREEKEGRTIFIASNREEAETFLCNRSITIQDFKPTKA